MPDGADRNRAVELRPNLQQREHQFLCMLDSDDVMDGCRIVEQVAHMLSLAPCERQRCLLGCNFVRLPEGSTAHYAEWANGLTDERLGLERFREVTVRSHAQVSRTIDDTTAMLGLLECGATVGFATLSLSPSFWRVGLFGTEGILVMQGHETLTFTPREGEGWVKQFPKTDIEAAELSAFASAVAGGPAYPLPVEDAIHGVAVFEAMIGAATSGSTYAVVA